MFKRRVIIIVPLVFWALFITARRTRTRTSSLREATVPKLQLAYQQIAKKRFKAKSSLSEQALPVYLQDIH